MGNESEKNPHQQKQQQGQQDPTGSVNTSDTKTNPSPGNQSQSNPPQDISKKNPSQDSELTVGLSVPSLASLRDRPALLSFHSRKDVIDVVVGVQRDLAQGAGLNALDDFLKGEIEDRLQNLRALLLVGLRHHEEHAGTVLDVAR